MEKGPNSSGFQPVSRKKAPLTQEEINRRKEVAFFADFQLNSNYITIVGVNSWRSSTINGIYKPEIGKLSPSFAKVDNPSVCLIFFNFVWYLKFGSRTMCKLICHQTETYYLPYDIYTGPKRPAPNTNTSSSPQKPQISTFNMGTSDSVYSMSGYMNPAVVPAGTTGPSTTPSTDGSVAEITGAWQEKLGIFLPIYLDRKNIKCRVTNAPYNSDTMSARDSNCSGRRSISIASFSSRNPGSNINGRSSAHAVNNMRQSLIAANAGADCDTFELSPMISFKNTAGETGLNDALYLRYVLIVIALFEYDLYYCRKNNSNNGNRNSVTDIATTGAATATTSMSTEDMRLEVERIKNIFHGLLYTINSSSNSTNKTNSRKSVTGVVPINNINSSSSGAHHSTSTDSGTYSNASSASTVPWITNNDSSTSVYDLAGGGYGVSVEPQLATTTRDSTDDDNSITLNLPSSSTANKGQQQPTAVTAAPAVAAVAYKLLDVRKSNIKQELCNALQSLIIDADVYYTDLTIDYKNTSTRDSIRHSIVRTVSISGDVDDSTGAVDRMSVVSAALSPSSIRINSFYNNNNNNTAAAKSINKAQLLDNCAVTMNEVKDTLKLLLFSDVSLKADLIEWTAAEGDDDDDDDDDDDRNQTGAKHKESHQHDPYNNTRINGANSEVSDDECEDDEGFN